eukprot:c28090_g1_i1 orf=937-3135(-)
MQPSGLEAQLAFVRNADSERSKSKEEEHESRSGSDNMEGGGSGEEQDPDQPPRKKRYHRHSAHQIQHMESFFKECPHPDEHQRQEISKALGLSSRQVKFWFQNRRTQLKSQQERHENSHLRAENERLRTENITMREAIKNASCPACGGPSALGETSFDEHQLRIENAHLREELDRISSIAARYFGTPIPPLASLQPIPSSSLELAVGGGGFGLHAGSSSGEILPGPSVADVALRPGGVSELEKRMLVELAVTSLDEVHRMARAEEPLWIKGVDGIDHLSYDEYLNQFPRGIGPRPFGLKTEATRETRLVIMNGIALVDALFDANKWMEMFPSIISKAATVEVLSPGMGGTRDGALQLMYAEIQMLTPLVQGREIFFLRYCKQNVDKVWVVVDVSVDSLRDNPPPSLLRCRRRPSGCLIQDMPNGYAQVTWVEHVEADDRFVSRNYRQLVNSGMAFGAKRWVATLQRHCESIASLLATNIPARELGVIPSPEGRRGMLRLAQRMMNGFCSNVSASSRNSWYNIPNSGDENIRVMTRENPGNGVVLCAATSIWLPFPRYRVFDFLRDERFRGEWDVLANGPVQEMCHIAKGQHPGNCVSLLRVNGSNPSQSNVLFVQESCTDASSSLIVYAPLDFSSLNMVLQGEDPSAVVIIPSGFVILPDGPEDQNAGLLLTEGIGMENLTSNGSLLTVSFQIAVSHVPSSGRLSLESVNTVSNVIISTVQHIRAALQQGDF